MPGLEAFAGHVSGHNQQAAVGFVRNDLEEPDISSGKIKADTLIWREGLPSWVAVSTQADFAGVVPPAAPPPPPASGGRPQAVPACFTPDAADVEQNKVFAVLSYLPPLLFLVPLLAARQSRILPCTTAIRVWC